MHARPRMQREAKRSVTRSSPSIVLHNVPEGLVVATGVGSGDFQLALPILVGVAFLTGLIEGVAVRTGYVVMVQANMLLPWALAMAGGVMVYVVSDEIIPESHRKEHAPYATAGLMSGFVLMIMVDTALG